MGRSDDTLFADIDEMERFLMRANRIEKELKNQIYMVQRSYKKIGDWKDEIYYKTGDVLEKLDHQLDMLFSSIDELTKVFDLYIEDLRAYNDPNQGRFGSF